MTKAIKTAVVGYGFSAKTFHIPFVTTLAEFELSAISTSNQQAVAQDWPSAAHYSSAHDMLSQSDAELVIITAPNDVHFELAKLALENGKHVIIEKPFVTRVEDGEELIKLAEQKQRVLSVYHNRRWDGDFLTVKKMIEQGEFGELKHFESHFDRFRPQVRQRWREQATEGGGILFDLGPHLLDQALALFGLPEAITAQCSIMREGSNNVDHFDLTLHYPGHVAVLHADLFSAHPNQRFTIKGSKGSYVKYGLDPQEERLIAGQRPEQPCWADEETDQYGRFYDGEGQRTIATERGGYQHYFVKIAESIKHQTPPPVSAEESLWNIKLIDLAMESNRTGQTIAVK
ncbi:oxidoreductase [Vibrio sinaloensis]|uniref:oxidoreductase n=1 Tax=Photobacterium sp. (strain ATCC 43367) TaxID=379097 RepID=UPI0035EC02CE